MQNLLRQIIRNLGPVITDHVSSQFGISEDAAKKILPTIAPLVTFSLQEKTAQQSENSDILGDFLERFRSNKPEVESFFNNGGVNETVLTDLFGSSLIRIIDNLANNLQVGYIQAQSILASVTAIVLTYIAKLKKIK